MPRTKRQQLTDIPVRAPDFGNIPPFKTISYLVGRISKMNFHNLTQIISVTSLATKWRHCLNMGQAIRY